MRRGPVGFCAVCLVGMCCGDLMCRLGGGWWVVMRDEIEIETEIET